MLMTCRAHEIFYSSCASSSTQKSKRYKLPTIAQRKNNIKLK